MPSDSSMKSDEKPSDEENLCISVKSVGQDPPTNKNLRHLRNLRDKKNSYEKNPDEKTEKLCIFQIIILTLREKKAKKLQLWQKKVEIAIGRHLPKEI